MHTGSPGGAPVRSLMPPYTLRTPFTVYNSGTAYDENNDDIVARLGKLNAGTRAFDWAAFAGPGSSLIKTHNYAPFSARGFDPRVKQGYMAWGASFITGNVYMASGLAAGTGMTLNSGLLVDRVKQARTRPSSVNMIGWSRGAVTCHIMAHALKKSFPHVKVNIFAIDPVPGPGNFQTENVTVPSNVENYVAIMMVDEGRQEMQAADVKRLPGASATAFFRRYNFRGVHCTGVEPGATQAHKAVFQLVAHMAQSYLKAWGTRFTADTYIKSDKEVCELFAYVLNHAESFTRNTRVGAQNARNVGTTKAWKPLKNQQRGNFLNGYHRDVFTRTWGELDQYAAIVGPEWTSLEPNPRLAVGPVGTKLAQMQSQWPETFLSIRNLLLEEESAQTALASLFGD